MALPTWLDAAYSVGSDKGWLHRKPPPEEHASTALCVADAYVSKGCRAAHGSRRAPRGALLTMRVAVVAHGTPLRQVSAEKGSNEMI
jgi:hypothetical protein